MKNPLLSLCMASDLLKEKVWIRGNPGRFCTSLLEKLKPVPDSDFIKKSIYFCKLEGINEPYRVWKLKQKAEIKKETQEFLKRHRNDITARSLL